MRGQRLQRRERRRERSLRVRQRGIDFYVDAGRCSPVAEEGLDEHFLVTDDGRVWMVRSSRWAKPKKTTRGWMVSLRSGRGGTLRRSIEKLMDEVDFSPLTAEPVYHED